MKAYESAYRLSIPFSEDLVVRIDGKRFSRYTKAYRKPFDPKLVSAMRSASITAMKVLGAKLAYTQSDEITLLFSKGEKQLEHIFSGRIQKICSISSSAATAGFNSSIDDSRLAYFDARAWGVPASERSNVILWRVQDARRNAVSSLYHSIYGHKAMQGKSSEQMIRKLGEYWYNLNPAYKYGVLYSNDGECSAEAFYYANYEQRNECLKI